MSTIDDAKQALAAPTPNAAPTPKMEALIEAMYIAANSDEDFGPKEREQFVSNVVGICRGSIKPDEVKGVLLKLKGKAKEGRGARLKSIAGRLPTQADKEHAFALACNMALADGIVLDEEKAFTDELATALGINAERAAGILEEIASLLPEEE